LYDSHCKLDAKLVDFAGYLMPITYPNGIVSEYLSVREKVGMFDVSHMGQIYIDGKMASSFVQKVISNDIHRICDGQAIYTLMCYEDGGIVDDLIVYRISELRYLMIVNASNIIKDYKWLCKNNDMGVDIVDRSDSYSLIALQGPDSLNIAKKIFEIMPNLDFFNHASFNSTYGEIFLSRTGYTGEHGYEIMIDNNNTNKLWDDLLELGVKPCGLASRDILRLEMGYCLYGNDINSNSNPISANLGWVTKLNKKNFIGKEVLVNYEPFSKLVQFKLLDRGIPRNDYKIFCNGIEVGYVTSGAYSPKLSSGIGMGYVQKNNINSNKPLCVQIRNDLIEIEIVKGPFIEGTSLLNNE
tara:strand:- start:603 stop:1667 length:1065 start_codon:yes stop_codon:yes gene_type:complete